MPTWIRVQLRLQNPPPHIEGFAVRAAIYDCLRQYDPERAGELHEERKKPVGLSLLPQRRAGVVECRARLLDDALLSWFLQALGLGRPFGQAGGEDEVPYLVGQVYGVALERQVSYEELYAQAMSLHPEGARLRFLSPTAVTSGGQTWDRPIPVLIWGGLASRWKQHAPKELRVPESFWEWCRDKLKCGMYDVRPAMARLGNGQKPPLEGFVGLGLFKWPLRDEADLEMARWGALLALFAEYAGIGAKTSYGCGEVEVRLKLASG